MRLTTQVTSQTLLGSDEMNCFSLAAEPGDFDGVRIVNMRVGPFQRALSVIHDGCIEVEMIDARIAVVTDSRVGYWIDTAWCTACCPFRLLPEDQQRAFLRRMQPRFDGEGRLFAWYSDGSENIDAQVDEWMARLSS